MVLTNKTCVKAVSEERISPINPLSSWLFSLFKPSESLKITVRGTLDSSRKPPRL